MKSSLILFASFLIISSFAHGQQLRNASFEVAPAAGVPIPAWGVWGGHLERVQAPDWYPVLHGEAMLAYRHWEVREAASSGIFQDVLHVQAGIEQTFRINVFFDTPEAGSLPDSIEMRLESVVGENMATITSRQIIPADQVQNEWLEFTLTGLPATDSLRVLLIINPSTNPGGAVKFDHFSVSPVSPSR